jgi:hypothetical protein
MSSSINPHLTTVSSARTTPIRTGAQICVGLLGVLAFLLPADACERHLNGHQGAQGSTAPQGSVQR